MIGRGAAAALLFCMCVATSAGAQTPKQVIVTGTIFCDTKDGGFEKATGVEVTAVAVPSDRIPRPVSDVTDQDGRFALFFQATDTISNRVKLSLRFRTPADGLQTREGKYATFAGPPQLKPRAAGQNDELTFKNIHLPLASCTFLELPPSTGTQQAGVPSESMPGKKSARVGENSPVAKGSGTAVIAAVLTAGTLCQADAAETDDPDVPDCTDAPQSPAGSSATVATLAPSLQTTSGIRDTAAACVPGSSCDPIVSTESLPARMSSQLGGDLQARLRTTAFRSLGFRYAASRDTAGAAFTNPSAAVFEERLQIDGSFNTSASFAQVSARVAGEGSALGFAFALQNLTDRRRFQPVTTAAGTPAGAAYAPGGDQKPPGTFDTALSAFYARQFGDTVAASVGIARQTHRTCACDATIVRSTHASGLVDQALAVDRNDAEHAEVGVSAGVTWQWRPTVRLGLAATNIGPRNPIATMHPRDRAVGAGIAWFHSWLHLGADVEQSDVHGVTSSVGLNVITPWDGLELRTGYVSGVNTANAGVTYKGFDYTLVDQDGRWKHMLGVSMRF